MFEKDLSRSNRRHHNERLKKNRQDYFRHFTDPENTPRQKGIYLNTPRRCSCWMCGNARKYYKALTLKEESFFDVLKDGLSELI